MRILWALLLLVFPAWAAKDSCVECHTVLEGSLQAPAARFAGDVHAHRGFGCAACHGGDPASDDPEVSMNRARGFLGKIARTAVPGLCARCHSDAALIHQFNPRQRVDQLAQYRTSVHGKRLAAGDASAANCVDCHSVHDIRAVKDALSPVHPLRLPATCARCHADSARMAKYKLPVDQFAQYRGSVHWEALARRGDLSAPSCASCHGNHGAAPPEVASVGAVCGTCHALLEDLFSKSPHQPVFQSMGLAGCVVCHGNHGVQKPTPELLSGPKAVCAQCHSLDSAGGQVAARMHGRISHLRNQLVSSREILERASRSGMEVSEALLRHREGDEALVKARVAVHTFRAASVDQHVDEGLAISAETFNAGAGALHERDRRRIGLAVSLIAILVTIAGLWLALRAIEAKQRAPELSRR
jgi:hypothetical protein